MQGGVGPGEGARIWREVSRVGRGAVAAGGWGDFWGRKCGVKGCVGRKG